MPVGLAKAVAVALGGSAVAVATAVAVAAGEAVNVAAGVAVRVAEAAAVAVVVAVRLAGGTPGVVVAVADAVAVAVADGVGSAVANTATMSAAEMRPSPFRSQLAGSLAKTARMASSSCELPDSHTAKAGAATRQAAKSTTARPARRPARRVPGISGIMGRVRVPMPVHTARVTEK